MIDRIRFWIIKKLASKSVIAINITVIDGVLSVSTQDRAFIYGCNFISKGVALTLDKRVKIS